MTQSLSPELERKAANVRALLDKAVSDFGDVVYANSLGLEAMVLTDIIWTQVPGIEIFSVDTGRLHEETYSLLDRVQRRYGKRIRLYYPQAEHVESFVSNHGINGFYAGVEERLGCCHIRKVEPFRRAIAGHKAWVTGVRREQSAVRAQGDSIEWDQGNGLYRVSPLLEWSQAEVREYVQTLKLPYNPLHDRNFPSIGCAPCTRAIEPGQDSRAGRWWWENSESRECGLQPRIRVVPAAAVSAVAAAR
jgi:phosphoadenosine phosphosulfate reductase